MSSFNISQKELSLNADKTKTVIPAKTKPVKTAKPGKADRGGGSGCGKSMKNNVLDDGSLYNDPSALDERDPNYDSEEETGREYIPDVPQNLPIYNPELRSSVKTASMKLPEYKKEVEKFLEEYFSSSDADEWKRCIVELNCPEYSYELVKRAISMSLDRDDRERCVCVCTSYVYVNEPIVQLMFPAAMFVLLLALRLLLCVYNISLKYYFRCV